jgi:hypothetical protein
MAKEMADRQAIADLFSEYAWALDAKDWDLLRQVLHEDERGRGGRGGDRHPDAPGDCGRRAQRPVDRGVPNRGH